VVLLHAGIADRRMWRNHLEPLAQAGFRVVAIDLPGFGDAPVAQVEDAPWKDVLETVDDLGIERAALIGNSFGGLVALAVAASAPETVDALVLVSSPAPGVEPTTELAAAWAAEEGALERADIDGAVIAVLDAWLPADAPAALRDEVAMMQRRALELQAEQAAGAEAPFPIDDELMALARIDAPVLVAVGERDMPDFHAAADAFSSAFPNPRVAVIAGARHLAPLETADAFRELLLGFLQATDDEAR
jgi:pimeloyl-ACP methyl ester carboxylesterase